MSISDTQAAKKYASIAEVAAAQTQAALQQALKAPDYASEALTYRDEAEAFSGDASQSASNAASSQVQALQSVNNASDFAQAASVQAGASAASALSSATSAALAQQAASDAGDTYASTAAGLAATTSGKYFRVPQGTLSEISFIYYLNNAGSALAVAEQVGMAAFNARLSLTASSLISSTQDSGGLPTIIQDELGGLYLPGNAETVQSQLSRVKKNSSPYLNLMSDSNNAVFNVADEMGGISIPDLPGTIQSNIKRNQEQLLNLIATRQVYDARDAGLRNELGDRNEFILNNLAATVSANGGGVIYVPKGNWGLIKPILPLSGVSWIGDGMDATIFRPMGSLSAFDAESEASYLTGCVFSDFGIDGQDQVTVSSGYTSSIKGMYFQFFKRCFFNRLKIVNTGATGLGIDYAYDSTITNVITENCGRLAPAADGSPGASGIGIGTGGNLDEPLYIAGTVNRNNKNFGIFFEWQFRANSTNHSRYSIVSGNTCTGNYGGLGDCGLDGLISIGNHLCGNQYGFLLDTGTLVPNPDGRPAPGSRGIFQGNDVSRNIRSGIKYDGSKVAGVGYDWKSNKIEDNGAYGLEMTMGTKGYSDAWIDGNSIARNQLDGIRLIDGSINNLDITNNRVFNNGQNTTTGGSGIVINSNVTYGSISSNKLRDTQATATQKYGLAGTGALNTVDIAENHFVRNTTTAVNLTGTQTGVTFGRNPGYN